MDSVYAVTILSLLFFSQLTSLTTDQIRKQTEE